MVRRILDGEWIQTELSHRRKDGTEFPVEVSAGPLELGGRMFILAVDRDITHRRQIETARENLIQDLKDAFEKIKTLKGRLPICASCKKIRDDKGYWSRIEEYIGSHTDAEFTHGICPDCMKKLYPGMTAKKQ
jgi:PAS domain-containing protein